jgi:hypothetical protein
MAAISMVAAPAIAAGPDGEFDPCKNRGLRRIAIVFAKKGDECKGNVYPDKKRVCGGDTVLWSVINACDVEQVADIRLQGLERVATKCTTIRQLDLAGSKEIRCQLRPVSENVKQEYEVAARVGKSRAIVDPELEIRRPN